MVQYCPTWSKMVPISLKLYKMVQNGPRCSNIAKHCKMFKHFQNGLILSNIDQNNSKWSKKVQNGPKLSTNYSKWSNMIQIHHKKNHKMTAVGATAAGLRAVRNNPKFVHKYRIGHHSLVILVVLSTTWMLLLK